MGVLVTKLVTQCWGPQIIGLGLGSCFSPYSLPSPLEGDAVAQSWCYHCCDGPRSCPSIVDQFHVDAVVMYRGISFLHQNQVTLFYSGSDRGASAPRVVALSLEASLLMAVL